MLSSPPRNASSPSLSIVPRRVFWCHNRKIGSSRCRDYHQHEPPRSHHCQANWACRNPRHLVKNKNSGLIDPLSSLSTPLLGLLQSLPTTSSPPTLPLTPSKTYFLRPWYESNHPIFMRPIDIDILVKLITHATTSIIASDNYLYTRSTDQTHFSFVGSTISSSTYYPFLLTGPLGRCLF